jgi:ABC-type dipeptide/oligopeptide/nickel transport system permease subunit
MTTEIEKQLAIPAGAGVGDLVGIAEEPAETGTSSVRARGYWESVWLRLRRDKLALVGAGFIAFLFLVAFVGAPIAAHLLGHGPDDQFFVGGVDQTTLLPAKPWTHVPSLSGGTQLLMLGGDSTLGRDEFLRLLYGAQISLEVGIGATLLSMTIGLLLGSIAGFFRGWVDTIISRLTEIVMAFPYLLFVIALAATLGQGVITLIIVFGLFSWFYSARVFRSIVLSLREKEFVEAARMIGASDGRIIRSHILPHLVGPTIVFSTLNVAQFILAEAGLSFLGLGIKQPTASWGNLLSDATAFITTRPVLLIWPGIALVLTTLAFNLLGDGLRDAFDPRGGR